MSGRGARERRRLRRHREAMQLAVREGLTLDEANERIDSYEEQLPRLEAAEAAAPTSLPLAAAPAAAVEAPADDDDDRRLPWWQRY